jgi:hypothetical protein
MLGFKLWHVLSVALFVGAIFVMVALQALLEASARDDAERKGVARVVFLAARLAVMPASYLAFLSGLAYFVWGIELFRRTPHVHVMLLCGFLAVGMGEMWRARARKLHEGLEAGRPFGELRGLVSQGRLFAFGALLLSFAAFFVAIFRVPGGR